VIERYAAGDAWPHRRVLLFILQDLQPLARQLKLAGTRALLSRPAACVYDLAGMDDCYVFVNEQAMEQGGYWDDVLSTTGLLAHEHAHPLAENATIRASRCLRADLDAGAPERARLILAQLAETIAWGAPRELFANQFAAEHGFDAALLRLNHNLVERAGVGVRGRPALAASLQEEAGRGALTQDDARRLLWIGDLQAHLPLAIELAPFYTAGRAAQAQALEDAIRQQVFAALPAPAWDAFVALRDHYQTLQPDWGTGKTISWSAVALQVLGAALARENMSLKYQFRIGQGRSGWLI